VAKFERENMAEDAMERFNAMSEFDQLAVEAIVETGVYNLEEALEIVKNEDYEFYPEISSLTDLARKFVQEELHDNPKVLRRLKYYIDYKKIAADLYRDNYRETSLGVVQIPW